MDTLLTEIILLFWVPREKFRLQKGGMDPYFMIIACPRKAAPLFRFRRSRQSVIAFHEILELLQPEAGIVNLDAKQ
jgi:hypothetical protein